MRRGRQVGAVTAIVAVLAVSVVLALPSDDRQGGSAPALTSPQDVMAESGGVTLAISGAEFSGTATFIELAARVAGAAPAGGKVVALVAAGVNARSRGDRGGGVVSGPGGRGRGAWPTTRTGARIRARGKTMNTAQPLWASRLGPYDQSPQHLGARERPSGGSSP
ncbi:MAG: hypothetical protein IPI85_11615 [Dehalococcoidia bacterium]|nr:hypothetical protein [Dehalococcoidia bacterium]